MVGDNPSVFSDLTSKLDAGFLDNFDKFLITRSANELAVTQQPMKYLESGK